MKSFQKLLLPLLALVLTGCQGNTCEAGERGIIDYTPEKEVTNDQFNFEGNYEAPELTIDGIADEPEWELATAPIRFGNLNRASVRVYRGKKALFFFFEVEDRDLQTLGYNNGDDVTESDSIEVYLDFNNDGAARPQSDDLQINIGAHGKTRIFVGSGGSWGAWNGLLDYEIVLNGTLNEPGDVDVGYSVELMIPYSQVGIDRNSDFGMSLGHVMRGEDVKDMDDYFEGRMFRWEGWVFNGIFVDPQSPASYVVLHGNEFYSRGDVPKSDITVSGYIKNQINDPVEGVSVQIGELPTVQSDANGLYVVENVNPNVAQTFKLQKQGFVSLEQTVPSQTLRNIYGNEFQRDFVLIDESIEVSTTLTGKVLNPSVGTVEGANVSIYEQTHLTDANGEFTFDVKISGNATLKVEKEGFQPTSIEIDNNAFVANGVTSLGEITLASPAQVLSFGGQRGIPSVETRFYRSLSGIHFDFYPSQKVDAGDHIELFIDSGTSFYGRDTSDYRIDFDSLGNINIINFGGGSNTLVSSSGITNNAYQDGTQFVISTFIPFSFFSLPDNSVIGISAGYWSQRLGDWDGWGFNGLFVPPEYSSEYVRIGLNNVLYRYNSNEAVNVIYGSVLAADGSPVSGSRITTSLSSDPIPVAEDGRYSLAIPMSMAVEISASANGYQTKTILFAASELSDSNEVNFTLIANEALIKGSINAPSGIVYLQDQPETAVAFTNGQYEILVPATGNARLVFEANGYTSFTRLIGRAALVNAVQSGEPFIADIVLQSL